MIRMINFKASQALWSELRNVSNAIPIAVGQKFSSQDTYTDFRSIAAIALNQLAEFGKDISGMIGY